MSTLSYSEIQDDALNAAWRAPPAVYFLVVLGLAGLVGIGGITWAYQVRTGMGVAGISHPGGWGFYITNFVFWVGIAHSGTLISAILYLVRAKWRNAVSRASEAMTIIAIAIAGTFPLIHLGRLWVFYYILPYPSSRQIWPNFISPLVFDVLAVSTYFTVSLIFFYVGMIPDLAAARDRARAELGETHWRTRLYLYLSIGWTGSSEQLRHYSRAYLFFAALATPLVVSVHSIVSWDFALGILPGWHTTLFPPYFVAGAIHSGLAMVLILLIPLRRVMRLQRLITGHHFDMLARTMIVTALIMGYSYVIEPFIAWYSANVFERQFADWRAFDAFLSPLYWAQFPLNVLAPLTFVFAWARKNESWLLAISVLVVAGMWIERLVIVTGSLAHDFMPHNWGTYAPTIVEILITLASFSLFFFAFLVFLKLFPAVASSEVKEEVAEEELGSTSEQEQMSVGPGAASTRGRLRPMRSAPKGLRRVVAVYQSPKALLAALKEVSESRFVFVETYTPMRLDAINVILGQPKSPVRLWTLFGAVSGLIGGFALAIYAVGVNELIVGGKPPVSIIPFCLVGFEGTILLGTLASFAGMLVHTRLGPPKLPETYDARFSRDKFGLVIACERTECDEVHELLAASGPEETHVVE